MLEKKIKENGKKIEILKFSCMGHPDLAGSSDGRERKLSDIHSRENESLGNELRIVRSTIQSREGGSG